MTPPKITTQLNHMQMVCSRLAFAKEMPPRNTLLPTIFITDVSERYHAFLGNRDLPHGDGNINNGFSGKPANCCAPYMLEGNNVLTDSNTQPLFFFGKQVMPPLGVWHESNGSSF